MSLLDSYTGLVVSCMRGRFSRQGRVVLVPWFVRCFRVGSISRFMFLSQFYFEEILDGLVLRFYFTSPQRNAVLVVLHSCNKKFLLYLRVATVGLPIITTTRNMIGQKASSDRT